MLLILLHALSFATAPLLSLASPFKIFIFSQALYHGWRRSLWLALTPLIADIPVVLLVWLIVSQMPTAVLNILRIIGGFFFFFLAYIVYRNAHREGLDASQLSGVPQGSFWQAVVTVWVSPQVYINWSTIGMPAMLQYVEQSFAAFLLFTVGFYTIWVGGLALEIVLFAQIGRLNPQANRLIFYLAALLLIGFGLYQIWLGATALL
jgi:threonine/homoserine/homoserine lactone efflux protein